MDSTTDMPRESAGGVVVGPQGNVVIVCQHGNSWSFPKGGVEEWGSRRRSFFLFKTSELELKHQDSEVTEARWATLDEALALLTHPKDKAFFSSVRDRIHA